MAFVYKNKSNINIYAKYKVILVYIIYYQSNYCKLLQLP